MEWISLTCRPNSHNYGFRFILALSAIGLLLGAGANLAPAEPKEPSVLMIGSYHQGDSWQDNLIAGVNSVFTPEKGIVLSIEGLDARRHPEISYEQEFVKLLLAKYQKTPPDLILLSDDAAYDFFLRHRTELFPTKPVVFFGLNDLARERLAGQKNITGLFQGADPLASLEFALKVHPQVKRAYAIVSDVTEFDQYNLRQFRRVTAALAGRIEIRELLNITPAQLPTVIGRLPSDSILFRVSNLMTLDGKTIPAPESVRLITAQAKVPLYTMGRSAMGYGTVGGFIVTSFSQGATAAQMALRILGGEPADSIPIQEKGLVTPMFDWQQLQRFGIREKDLPPGSVLINKPFSIYENYRGLIWGVIFAITILSWLVILLWISRARLVRAEQALRLDEARLAALLRLNQMETDSSAEIAHAAVEEGVRLTQSQLGYIAIANHEETVLTMAAWSSGALEQSQIDNPPVEFPVADSGLLGEAVRQRRPIITNSYKAANLVKKDLPVGHVPLQRHMSVPIFDAGRIVAVAGAANKTTPYSERDVQQLTLLMTGMWQMIQRRKAEADLRAKTKELDVFFTATLDLLCIADLQGYFRRLNPEWERTLGYRLEELEGRRFLDFVHPEDLEAALQTLSQLADQQTIQNFTSRYRCKDGSYRWIEWRSYPVGQLIYAAARDVTERRQSEEARLEMERRIQHSQKLESLGVLAGGIAHDFNNLLMAILGNIELAQESLAPYAPAQPYVQDAGKAAQRAAELTRQMLAYSGKGRFLIQTLDLSAMVDEITHLLKTSVSKKVELNLRLDRSLPPIQADAAQMQQVVMNLIVNASEAIGEQSGTISVVTGVRQCDSSYLAYSRLDEKPAPGAFVFLEVSDTGCGMDEQTQQHLFDPFFTTKFTGRGLGMSAVLGIVRGHQGAIMVYSEPGKGTTFKLLFPAGEPQTGALATAAADKELKPVSLTFTGKVLLVDDEDFVRSVGAAMLERLGCQVLTAADGPQAIEVLRQHAPDIACVLLDLTMPKMDGEATFRALKQIKPDIRVILSSGYNHQDVTQRFAGKGLAGFIQKPYQLSNLQQALQGVI